MIAVFERVVDDWVQAMWGLSLLLVAWLASVVLALQCGRLAERRDIDAGRARVRAAVEDEVAETVRLPAQRQGSDR